MELLQWLLPDSKRNLFLSDKIANDSYYIIESMPEGRIGTGYPVNNSVLSDQPVDQLGDGPKLFRI